MILGLSEGRLEVTMAIGSPYYWAAAKKGKKGEAGLPSGQDWSVVSGVVYQAVTEDIKGV
jgi:hypothetical protein